MRKFLLLIAFAVSITAFSQKTIETTGYKYRNLDKFYQDTTDIVLYEQDSVVFKTGQNKVYDIVHTNNISNDIKHIKTRRMYMLLFGNKIEIFFDNVIVVYSLQINKYTKNNYESKRFRTVNY